MTAKETLEKAAHLVNGDRNETHGEMHASFEGVAIMWNAWLHIRRDPASPLTGTDVAQMMSLLKKARTQTGTHNPDDYVDDSGYVGCASELNQSD